MSQKPMITVNGFYKEVTEGFITLSGSHKKIVEAFATIDGKYKKIWETTNYVKVPKQINSLTYNKTTLYPTWENYDNTLMTISGTTSATDAGTYYVTFDLIDKETCVWEDGTTDSKTVSWSISKAKYSETLTVDPSVVYFNKDAASQTTVELTVSGYPESFSVEIESTAVNLGLFTAEKNGNKIIVTRIVEYDFSSFKIYVKATSTNYTDQEVSISVAAENYVPSKKPQNFMLSTQKNSGYSTDPITLDFGTSKDDKVIYYEGCYTNITHNVFPSDQIFEYTYTTPDVNGEGSITIKRNTNNAVKETGWYFYAASDDEYDASDSIAVNIKATAVPTLEEQIISVNWEASDAVDNTIKFTSSDNVETEKIVVISGAVGDLNCVSNPDGILVRLTKGDNQSVVIGRNSTDAINGTVQIQALETDSHEVSNIVDIPVRAEAYVKPEEPSIEYILVLPTQSGSLTYNNSEQTPDWNNYDPNKMTLSVTAQTNAGTYTATFTPKSGYGWTDNTTASKTANWSIGKATWAKPIMSPTSFSFSSSDGTTATVTSTCSNYSSGLSVYGEDTSYIDASVSGNKVTIQRKTTSSFNGKTALVYRAGNDNYFDSANTTLTVSASAYSNVTKLEQEIKANIYSIDFKQSMSSETIYMQNVQGNLSATVNGTDNLSVEVNDTANTVTVTRKNTQAITNATVSIVASETDEYEKSNTINITVNAQEILTAERPQTPMYITYTGLNVLPTIQLPENVEFVGGATESWVNVGDYSTAVRPSDGYYWRDSVEDGSPDASEMTIQVYIQPIQLEAPELKVIQGSKDLGTDVSSETLVEIVNNNSINDVTVDLDFTIGNCLFCSVSGSMLSVKRNSMYTPSFSEDVGVRFKPTNDNYFASEFTYITFTGDQLAELPTESLEYPYNTSGLVYNAGKQSPTWQNYDSNKMTLEGDTEAINAGTYTATFTPLTTETTKYVWKKTETQDPKSVEWEISTQNFANSVHLKYNGQECNQTSVNNFSSAGPIIISIETQLSDNDKVNVSFEGFNILEHPEDLVYIAELSGDTGSVTVSTESTNFDNQVAVYNFTK